MNIKQHIEAGHYPIDDKGRALVPMQDGNSATICATDAPGTYCILGFAPTWQIAWNKNGAAESRSVAYSGAGLLPPRPRKMAVKGWAIMGSGGNVLEIRHACPDRLAVSPRNVVELTGEYEETWS